MSAKNPQATKQIYQLKVTLKQSKPRIWRRIQVPEDISLYKLHIILQIVMGWQNYHLYEFHIGDLKYGEPDPYEDPFFKTEIINAKRARLGKIGPEEKTRFLYRYDFGDDWEHGILVEKIMAAEPGVHYPVCTAGERACPPEDCGGMWGYMNLLEIISDSTHDEYKERMEWLGGPFDPEAFNLQEINDSLKKI